MYKTLPPNLMIGFIMKQITDIINK
jgi:hypothetical protein